MNRFKFKMVLFFVLYFLLAKETEAQNRGLNVGDAAPEISMHTPQGKQITLSSLKGKLVLVDFWASWCAPCVEEQPELNNLYTTFNPAGKQNRFEILGVSLDKSKENWTRAIKRLRIGWPQVSDLKFWKSKAASDYDIQELPYNVLIDENGKIAAINLHGPSLIVFIKKHLENNKL